MTVGRRIKEARTGSGRRREELAVALGVSLRTIQRWETGETTPSINQLRMVSAVTRKPLEFFLNGVSVSLPPGPTSLAAPSDEPSHIDKAATTPELSGDGPDGNDKEGGA